MGLLLYQGTFIFEKYVILLTLSKIHLWTKSVFFHVWLLCFFKKIYVQSSGCQTHYDLLHLCCGPHRASDSTKEPLMKLVIFKTTNRPWSCSFKALIWSQDSKTWYGQSDDTAPPIQSASFFKNASNLFFRFVQS